MACLLLPFLMPEKNKPFFGETTVTDYLLVAANHILIDETTNYKYLLYNILKSMYLNTSYWYCLFMVSMVYQIQR